MLEESVSTASHVSVAITTTDVDDVLTTGNEPIGQSASVSRGADFYFKCAVVIIGIVGATANALILYAMIASDQRKKHLLIFHQNACDLCSCLFQVVAYTLKLCDIPLTGTLGYWLCVTLYGETFVWCSFDVSVVNLMSVTIERYLKVVRPKWSKKLLRKWVIYLVIAFSWIVSILYNMTLVFSTSGVIGGVCYTGAFWKSRLAATLHTVWYFVSFFVVVIFVFFLCYWRILVVIRRQASVMAGHSGTAGSSAVQTQSHHIQSNVIKTMILVSAFYVIAWMPIRIYYMILLLNSNTQFIESVYYAVTFIAFLYICANPFIYATKFNPVKRILVGFIPCKKPAQEVDESVGTSGTRRTVQTTHA